MLRGRGETGMNDPVDVLIIGRPCDPLDAELIALMERELG